MPWTYMIGAESKPTFHSGFSGRIPYPCNISDSEYLAPINPQRTWVCFEQSREIRVVKLSLACWVTVLKAWFLGSRSLAAGSETLQEGKAAG